MAPSARRWTSHGVAAGVCPLQPAGDRCQPNQRKGKRMSGKRYIVWCERCYCCELSQHRSRREADRMATGHLNTYGHATHVRDVLAERQAAPFANVRNEHHGGSLTVTVPRVVRVHGVEAPTVIGRTHERGHGTGASKGRLPEPPTGTNNSGTLPPRSGPRRNRPFPTQRGEQMKCAIYARVSKADGSQHADNQSEALTAWAERLGHEVVQVYVDRQTGSTDDRLALKEALRGAHLRQFDVLLVAALDRVSRGGVASLAGILERLAASGVGIKSLREEWLDTTSPLTRELLVAVFGWIAKVERAQLIERTLAGMARAKRQGVRIGRPQAIDADQARRAFTKCGSLRKAAAELGVTEATIRRRLA